MLISKILMIAATILNLALGISVFIKSKNKVQKTFSYFIFLATIWVISNVLFLFIPKYFFETLTYMSGVLLAAGIFLWVIYYSKVNIKKFWKIFGVLVCILVALLTLIPNFILSTEMIQTPFGFDANLGKYFTAFTIPIGLILLISIIILLAGYKKSMGIKKLQNIYVIIGFIIPILIVLIFNFIFPYFERLYFARLDAMVSIIFVTLISYSIFKYRFMDIKFIVRKGLVNFLTLAIILFIYIYLLIFSKSYFEKTFYWSEQTTTIVLVIIIALTIEPLRRLLVKVIDKVFYSKQRNVDEEARKLKLILSSSMHFDHLINRATGSLKDFLQINKIYFLELDRQTGDLKNDNTENTTVSIKSTDVLFSYLQDNPNILITEEIPYLMEESKNGEVGKLKNIEEKLKQLAVSLVLPIGERGELVGVFLFGPKNKKDAYTVDAIQYLQRLQPQMTGAIANALLYKQAVERIGNFNK